jgi:hypothetical protein
MKYLKTFENNINGYSVGDIVICVDGVNDVYTRKYEPISGHEYKVTRIFKNSDDDLYVDVENSDDDDLYVDIIDMKNPNIKLSGWCSDRFELKLKYLTKKYNISL